MIKSISGIRGTIGGKPGDNLSPLDIVKFTAAYGSRVLASGKGKKIVVGRDGRISGEMVSHLVVSTLQGLGLDVIDLGLSTTPTVELAVTGEKAGGGIIITASHNSQEWNALKLLNSLGEFISAEEGAAILEKAAEAAISAISSCFSTTYTAPSHKYPPTTAASAALPPPTSQQAADRY